MSLNKFSERLKELRRTRGTFQAKLAEYLGLSTVTLSQYENEVRYPDTETLIKIAKYFNVSTDYLTGLSDYENPQEQEKLNIRLDEIDKQFNNLNVCDKKSVIFILERIISSILNEDDSAKEVYINGLKNHVISINTIQAKTNIAQRLDLQKNFDDSSYRATLDMLDLYKYKDSDIEKINDTYRIFEQILENTWQHTCDEVHEKSLQDGYNKQN